jgi:hypothetical protein
VPGQADEDGAVRAVVVVVRVQAGGDGGPDGGVVGLGRDLEGEGRREREGGEWRGWEISWGWRKKRKEGGGEGGGACRPSPSLSSLPATAFKERH